MIAFLVTGISRARWFHRLGTSFECITWNALNQLTAVTKNGVVQATYSYDPLGKRVERVAGGMATTWTYDSEDILRESVGTIITGFVHGPGIDEPLAMDASTSGLTYLSADGLGSIAKQTNATGAVMNTLTYDAWGGLQNGAPLAYGFTGREWDLNAQMYFYRARWYDPVSGRFVREDPAGRHDAIDMYVYVRNNPTDRVDPTGRESMNMTELKYCALHPMRCTRAVPCMMAANDLTAGSRDDTPENAFKHCFWSCCLTRTFGPDAAYEITTNHEANQRFTGPCSSAMDMANNAAGRAFAMANPGRECKEMCGAAWLKCSPSPAPCTVPQ